MVAYILRSKMNTIGILPNGLRQLSTGPMLTFYSRKSTNNLFRIKMVLLFDKSK